MLPSQPRHPGRLIQQLQEITGCTKKAATDLLRQNNFHLERALDSFYSLPSERRTLLLGSPSINQGHVTSSVDEKKAASFFDKYAIPHKGGKVIKEEGLERLSSDLSVGLDDVFFLLFAFHCGCNTQGVITREDFMRGLKTLQVDTLDALKDSVSTHRISLFNDFQLLRKVYSYAFTYSLEPLQKQLPTELAIAYWQLLLKPLEWCLFRFFLHYIEHISGLAFITKDVWLMVLEFALTSQVNKNLREEDAIDRALVEYEDDGAWPLVIDNFVEWMREERRK